MIDLKSVINQISDEFQSTFTLVPEIKLLNLFSRPDDFKNAEDAIKKVLGNRTIVEFNKIPGDMPIYEVVIHYDRDQVI